MASRTPDPTSLDAFAPWRNVARLPEQAPVRRLPPDQLPTPAEVRTRLRQEGIGADQAGAIITALFTRGWPFWLIGGPSPARRFTACVLERRFGAVWAMGEGTTPAAALGAVLVLCLETPPWDVGPEEVELPSLPDQEAHVVPMGGQHSDQGPGGRPTPATARRGPHP